MKAFKRTLGTSAFATLILLAGTGLAHAGNGSSVTVGAEVGAAGCAGNAASVHIDVAVTAGSAAPVTFHVSTVGGPFTDAGTFNNWTSYGRTKGMVETLVLSRPSNGLGAQVQICVAQPGSNGNDARSACTTVSVPGVQCSEEGGGGSSGSV